jgi:hypothetical protein
MRNQHTKKGGRPKKELGQKKNYRINIKLATEDYYSLIARVRKSGTTISEFARACLKKGLYNRVPFSRTGRSYSETLRDGK